MRDDRQHAAPDPSRSADADVVAEVETARRRVFTAWEAARRHARFFADDPGRTAEAEAREPRSP